MDTMELAYTPVKNLMFKNRGMGMYQDFILLIPYVNGAINGLVNAYHQDNGQRAWSCPYVDNVATGMYTAYEDGAVLYSIEYETHDQRLEEIATSCAEYVLL
jgi:hypothetical protein